MVQIQRPEAHAITGGSPSVVVGDIDTGLDYTHPDLAANVDFSKSASCVERRRRTGPAAWMDDNGHGTHTAGTIAAASNGIGIVGVAPNVKIAGIKAGNAEGSSSRGRHLRVHVGRIARIQVTNNSYFADPWLFNCKNDPEQRAIWDGRAPGNRLRQVSKGTVVVAAAGNQADDLAHPTQDATSPDDTNPVMREITNACAVVPGRGGRRHRRRRQRQPRAQVVLFELWRRRGQGDRSRWRLDPAGDRGRAERPGAVDVAGELLPQTAPARGCRSVGATYCYLQGTSMASPHAAGVAALIVSQGPASPAPWPRAEQRHGGHPWPAPTRRCTTFSLGVDGGAPQVCQGGTGYNSFNGHGQINALRAIGG